MSNAFRELRIQVTQAHDQQHHHPKHFPKLQLEEQLRQRRAKLLDVRSVG